MKKILAILFVVLFLVGCTTTNNVNNGNDDVVNNGNGNDTPPAKEKIVIGANLIDMTNQFFVDMIEGGNVAAEDYDVEIIWNSADGNIDNQISLMENFIEQGVDAILVNPIDSDALNSTIHRASDAGIPVINMAGQSDAELSWTTVYNDEENTRIIGHIVANLVDFEGKVALVYGNEGNLVSDLRQKGFQDAIAEYPDIELIEQPGNWDGPTGLTVAQNIMAANPDLKAIHSVSEVVTLAIHQAVVNAGKEEDIIITSYDGNPEGIDAVENEDFYLTLLTGAKKTGYWNVQMGVMVANGIYPEEKILNLDTHFVMTQEMQDRVKEMDIDEEFSMLLPEEARAIVSEYRDELYDPNLVK